MGLFGCSHTRWVKVGRKHEGIQQLKCAKCGKLKNKRVISWGCVLFGLHAPGARIKGRKKAPKTLKCKKCGKSMPLEGKGR